MSERTASPEDVDYSDLEAKYNLNVTIDEKLDCLVIVDQIPRVDQSKKAKFVQRIKDTLLGGMTLDDEAVFIPADPDTGVGREFMFVELGTPALVSEAMIRINGARITKANVLSAFSLAQTVERPLPVFEPEQYQAKEWLLEWLMDSRTREQFLVHHGGKVSVYWWNAKDESPEQVVSRKAAGDAVWSNTGSFMAVLSPGEVEILGGAGMSLYQRVPHGSVVSARFSPRDNFLVTVAAAEHTVWNVHTGVKLASFRLAGPAAVESSSGRLASAIEWSFDEQYLAYCDPQIHCFRIAADTLTRLDMASIGNISVDALSWSPSSPHWMALWCPESRNDPAKVCIYSVPDMAAIKTKIIFHAVSCTFHWHNDSRYLAVCVGKLLPKKKTGTSVEIFRLDARKVSVEVIEIEHRLASLAWEPHGTVCSYVECEGERSWIHFHDLEHLDVHSGSVEARVIQKIEKSSLSLISWSPSGRFFVISGLDNPMSDGRMEFGCCDSSRAEIVGDAEHSTADQLQWDQSGRYLVSYTTGPDGDYAVWDFKGASLFRQTLSDLRHVDWRPKPPHCLDQQRIDEIVRDLEGHGSVFDNEDRTRSRHVKETGLKTSIQQRQEWEEWRSRCRETWCIRDSETPKTWLEKPVASV